MLCAYNIYSIKFPFIFKKEGVSFKNILIHNDGKNVNILILKLILQFFVKLISMTHYPKISVNEEFDVFSSQL